MAVKNCKKCGNEFTANRNDAYCNAPCQRPNSTEKAKARRNGVPLEKFLKKYVPEPEDIDSDSDELDFTEMRKLMRELEYVPPSSYILSPDSMYWYQRTKLNQPNLVWFGEKEPGRTAMNFDDELEVHTEFATAMGIPGPQSGETMRQFAGRVHDAWLELKSDHPADTNYLPMYDKRTKQFTWEHSAMCLDGVLLRNISFSNLWKCNQGDRIINE
jgi:hypothetical protein